MPAKKPTKSRTSKSKLSKKNSAPRWVIGIVLAIVVATGAFLVYNSFASTEKSGYSEVTRFCRYGECTRDVIPGFVATRVFVRKNESCARSKEQWTLRLGTKGSTVWRCTVVYEGV